MTDSGRVLRQLVENCFQDRHGPRSTVGFLMAYIEQVPEEEAEGSLARMYESARTRAGGVAHIIKIMIREPAVLEGSMMFYLKLMKSPNGLSAARREMLAAVVSNLNDCYY